MADVIGGPGCRIGQFWPLSPDTCPKYYMSTVILQLGHSLCGQFGQLGCYYLKPYLLDTDRCNFECRHTVYAKRFATR